MTRYTKSMSETLEEVDEIAKTIPEVAPPGWGHTVAKKEKTKPNKPKSKIGGTAHEFQKDLDSGKFKGLPGDKTYKDKKASMFKLMWSMKKKGDKPHYKPGVKDVKKAQYKEEIEIDELVVTNRGSHPDSPIRKERPEKRVARLNKQKARERAKYKAARDELRKNEEVQMDELTSDQKKKREASRERTHGGKSGGPQAGRFGQSHQFKRQAHDADRGQKKPDRNVRKYWEKPSSMRSGPKGKLPEENIDEWGDTGILHQKSVALQGRPGLAKRKEKEKSAYQKNIDYDTARHAAKTKYAKKEAKSHSEFPADSWKTHRPDDKAVPGRTKTVVKARRKDKNYIDRPLKKEGRYASTWSDPRTGGSSSVDTVPDFAAKAKKGATSAPGSGSIAKPKKAKASDVNKSIEQQMADALKEAGSKWADNFKKTAAKRRGETNRRREAERDSPGQRVPPKTEETMQEAQWKVKLRGLPNFYVPGKSAGAVRQMLRKQLKRPMDDIEDIVRATPAAKKKDFRDRAQGQDSAVGSGKS